MIALIASPLFRYGVGALLLLGVVGGIYGKGRTDGRASERVKWERVMAEQKAEAARLIDARNVEIAVERERTAALNNKLEETVANDRREIDSRLADYNRAVAERLRAERARNSCAAARQAEAGGASSSEDVAAPGITVSSEAARDLGALMAEADELTSVMTACKAWALDHGK